MKSGFESPWRPAGEHRQAVGSAVSGTAVAGRTPSAAASVATVVPPARRRLLQGAGLGAGLAALALGPSAARARTAMARARAESQPAPVVWRCQMAWTLEDDFHAYITTLAEVLGTMTEGRLQLEVLPAGREVPTEALSGAVSRGRLEAAHRVLSLDAMRQPALGLWGSGPAFGMDGMTLLSWHQHGGGEAMLQELYEAEGLKVHSLLYGPLPTPAFGWFKRPISRTEDLAGMRFHAGGLAAQIYQELGATVFQLPVDEIVPALRRGEIEAAEFSTISSDRALGLPDVLKVCMLQSFHQITEQVELLVNRDAWNALSPAWQQAVNIATQAVTAMMRSRQTNANSTHYIEMREVQGVRFYKTPESVLKAQLVAWDRVTVRNSNGDPVFARVLDSMRRYAQRCVGWQNDAYADRRVAYNHYFAQRVASKSGAE